MVFSRKNHTRPDCHLSIEGQPISRTNCSKFLGVFIDDQLIWKRHISHISNKVAKGIGILIKARRVLSRASLIQLYYSFVYPYLNYCIHVWGSTYITNLNRLIILQKKAVRIICNVKAREHTAPLFKELNLLKVAEISTYALGCFMFRYIRRETPEVFDEFFEHNSDIHNYYTRQVSELHVPSVKSNLGKMGARCRGVSVWNTIMRHRIETNVTEYTFKRKLKMMLIDGKLV